jgi:hypothetical protein
MKKLLSPKTSETTRPSTQRHTPEDLNPQIQTSNLACIGNFYNNITTLRKSLMRNSSEIYPQQTAHGAYSIAENVPQSTLVELTDH